MTDYIQTKLEINELKASNKALKGRVAELEGVVEAKDIEMTKLTTKNEELQAEVHKLSKSNKRLKRRDEHSKMQCQHLAEQKRALEAKTSGRLFSKCWEFRKLSHETSVKKSQLALQHAKLLLEHTKMSMTQEGTRFTQVPTKEDTTRQVYEALREHGMDPDIFPELLEVDNLLDLSDMVERQKEVLESAEDTREAYEWREFKLASLIEEGHDREAMDQNCREIIGEYWCEKVTYASERQVLEVMQDLAKEAFEHYCRTDGLSKDDLASMLRCFDRMEES